MQRRLQAQAQGLDQRAARLGPPARVLLGQQQRLQSLAHRLAQAPRPRLERWRHLSAQAAGRMLAAGAWRLQLARSRHESAALRLKSLDPRDVLRRGYAWVEDDAGRAITHAAQLVLGQRIRAVWADGAARAQVNGLERPGEGTGSPIAESTMRDRPGPAA